MNAIISRITTERILKENIITNKHREKIINLIILKEDRREKENKISKQIDNRKMLTTYLDLL